MKCPNDTTVDLVMADRQGIEIDYCPTCRGVWLDRGELDKIIERAAATLPRAAAPAPNAFPAPVTDDRSGRGDRDAEHRRDWDDDDSHDHPRPFGKPKKKRSSFLGEMFDF